MLNAVNLLFLTYARMRGDLAGQMIVFFVIAVAAAEAAVGLAIFVALFRTHRTVDVDKIALLKW
jgi:NADH-quinone oxidoreductase subunit K